MRVLVTGAGGYVGRQTLEPLARMGFEVVAVARRPLDLAHNWRSADLLRPGDAAALIEAVRPSHLLHLAWTTAHGEFWSDPANSLWQAATLDLLGRFAAVGGRRFVEAGSCAEYDWSGSEPLSETDTPLRPRTLYGKAKAATFERGREAAARLGVSFAHGRLFHSYGPFEQRGRLVPSLILALLEGRPARLASPGHVRDFLDVRDIGRLLALLLASEVEGAVNVASGEGVAVGRVAALLLQVIGRGEIVEAAAARAGDPASIVALTRRLSAEVVAKPEISLEQGLADAVRWWRENGDSPL